MKNLFSSFKIDNGDISVPHSKKSRNICEIASAWTFKAGGIVHIIPLVLQELMIESQIGSKSSREESYAAWVKKFGPRSISFFDRAEL